MASSTIPRARGASMTDCDRSKVAPRKAPAPSSLQAPAALPSREVMEGRVEEARAAIFHAQAIVKLAEHTARGLGETDLPGLELAHLAAGDGVASPGEHELSACCEKGLASIRFAMEHVYELLDEVAGQLELVTNTGGAP